MYFPESSETVETKEFVREGCQPEVSKILLFQVLFSIIIMVKGGADNRKFRQVRREKRKGFNVACTSNTNKKSKHNDDENGEELVLENEVTVDVAATSKTQVSTSLVGDDAADDGQWVDIPDEQTVSKKKFKNIVVGGEKKLIGYRFFDCGILSSVFNKMICTDCKKVM